VVPALVGAGLWWAAAAPEPAAPLAGAPREYRTERGQTANVQLTDGTRVDLAPASRLVVTSMGSSGPRELELVGEAVFHVVHDEERPFLVRSAHAVTEDLGTVFAVRAYPEQAAVAVLVVEGRVTLRGRDAPAHSGTVLEPGQAGLLDLDGRVAVAPTADPDRYLGWSRGRVVFERTPLRTVVVELERWYDVDIEIPDSSVAEERITLDIPAGPLSDVIDAVVVPLNLRAERKGDVIRLSP
jgi:ferric-dicitrate binding protein FerR (iron transport regulator)